MQIFYNDITRFKTYIKIKKIIKTIKILKNA